MVNIEKADIIKFIIAFMILALFLSVKTVIFINLENLGVSQTDALQIRTTWDSFKADYAFIILSLIFSLIIALRFNIKGD
ncbi:MAG: hypothetical protein JW791_01675 [Nanoarchaeota archaeon]|nr:hypothetical protein [Nanoarchaeota archaeon]